MNDVSHFVRNDRGPQSGGGSGKLCEIALHVDGAIRRRVSVQQAIMHTTQLPGQLPIALRADLIDQSLEDESSDDIASR